MMKIAVFSLKNKTKQKQTYLKNVNLSQHWGKVL